MFNNNVSNYKNYSNFLNIRTKKKVNFDDSVSICQINDNSPKCQTIYKENVEKYMDDRHFKKPSKKNTMKTTKNTKIYDVNELKELLEQIDNNNENNKYIPNNFDSKYNDNFVKNFDDNDNNIKENANNVQNENKSQFPSYSIWIVSSVLSIIMLIIVICLTLTFFRYFLTYEAIKTNNIPIGIAALSPEIGKGIGSIFH